jgi:hypothetical protein
MLSVVSFLESKVIAKWVQREWFRGKTDTKWGRDSNFLLFLVNSCAQVRCRCFLTKAIWVPLTPSDISAAGPLCLAWDFHYCLLTWFSGFQNWIYTTSFPGPLICRWQISGVT